jgi:type II secretory pathway pseudopilin PulG
MSKQQRTSRAAVTLLEVMFSMGVILIGLVGVMSILPLAGRRAQDAVSLSVGASMGDNVLDQLTTRRWLASNRLLHWSSTGVVSSFTTSSTASPHFGSFCIDPLYFSEHTFETTTNGYSSQFFPFYKGNHDPTVDPSETLIAWPSVQPRMLRVGVNRLSGTSVRLTTNESFSFADSSDDLTVDRPTDRAAQALLPGTSVTSLPGGLSYGKRFSTGEFSWIATVDPAAGGEYASVSVAIIRNRQRMYSFPLTPGGVATAVSTPENNATDERVAYVSFAMGFRGGAGGVVHLLSSANTVSRLRSGDWIMLSRNDGTNPRHRWYRVVAVDGDSERFSGTPATLSPSLGVLLPGTHLRDIWRRKIFIDGPDWDFAYAPSGFATVGINNTFATLVEGVVSVTEHVVAINSL